MFDDMPILVSTVLTDIHRAMDRVVPYILAQHKTVRSMENTLAKQQVRIADLKAESERHQVTSAARLLGSALRFALYTHQKAKTEKIEYPSKKCCFVTTSVYQMDVLLTVRKGIAAGVRVILQQLIRKALPNFHGYEADYDGTDQFLLVTPPLLHPQY